MTKRNLLLFALAAILFTNCKKKEEVIPFDNSCDTTVISGGGGGGTGIPDSISRVTYNVRLKQDTTHPYLKWTSGICVLSQTEWDAIPTTSITTSVVTSIDLFTGVATPIIITIDITPGNYTAIGITMDLQDDGVNDNIILNGEYTHTNGSKIPIRFLFDSGETFEATLASYFFPPATNTTCWLELDPNIWFSTVPRNDLDNGTIDGSGVMIISEDVNTTVYDKVETQLGLTTTTSGTIVCE